MPLEDGPCGRFGDHAPSMPMRIVLMTHLYSQLTHRWFVKEYERIVPPPPGAEIAESVWDLDDDKKEPRRMVYSLEDDTLVYYFEDYARSDDDDSEAATKEYIEAGWERMDGVSAAFPVPRSRGYVSPEALADAEWELIAPKLSV